MPARSAFSTWSLTELLRVIVTCISILLRALSRDALTRELSMCAEFLELDGRNFHCWAYRMWAAEKAHLPAAEDFDFTTEKIMQVFL